MGYVNFVAPLDFIMASYTINKRKTVSGTPRYTTNVRVKKASTVVYRESRTFSKHSTAVAWGKNRVYDLEKNGIGGSTENITLGDAIKKYIEDFGSQLKRTKLGVLNLISDCDIANVYLGDLTPGDVINHCKLRNESGAGKSTINHDVSYIRSVLKVAKPYWGYDITEQSVIDAYPILHDLNLIGKSERRSRRPSAIELEKLREGLLKRESSPSSNIPFVDILDFSILSCMRIGEVCSIKWVDVDVSQKAVLVKDRKDPRKKTGNHLLAPLLGDAWNILQRQPRNSECIFPYNSRSVSSGFQQVRNQLNILDLKYHDLRREGASRLFEKGYTIDEVAQVTGHRNINTLWQVYTELYPSRLHDKYDEN